MPLSLVSVPSLTPCFICPVSVNFYFIRHISSSLDHMVTVYFVPVCHFPVRRFPVVFLDFWTLFTISWTLFVLPSCGKFCSELFCLSCFPILGFCFINKVFSSTLYLPAPRFCSTHPDTTKASKCPSLISLNSVSIEFFGIF